MRPEQATLEKRGADPREPRRREGTRRVALARDDRILQFSLDVYVHALTAASEYMHFLASSSVAAEDILCRTMRPSPLIPESPAGK